MIQKICAYEPQTERPDTEKVRFYNEMASKLDFGSSSEIIVTLGDFNRHVGKCAQGFEGVYGENGIGKIQKEDCWSSVMKELCVANTWFYKADKKITYSDGGCETEIDFVLVEEKYRKYVRDVKVIPWELQLRLVVVDLNKKVLKRL